MNIYHQINMYMYLLSGDPCIYVSMKIQFFFKTCKLGKELG